MNESHALFSDDYKEHLWEHPPCYAGHSPVGDVVVLGRNRDSSILDESNWEVAQRILSAACEQLPEEWVDENPDGFYDFRQSHWGVGWVETLIVTKDAHPNILDAAKEIIDSLSDYPVLDDSDYSEKCHEAIHEYWDNCTLADRIEHCVENKVSIFSARSNKQLHESIYDDLTSLFY